MIAEPIAKPRIWTYDEVRAINDDVRRELHDGEIYVMPSPIPTHQRIVTRLAGFLNTWAQQSGGEAIVSPLDMYVSETTYYIPDLIFYSGPQMEIIDLDLEIKNLRLTPHLVVEVLSPKTASNDRTLKTRAYADFEIAHYWIIDPIARTLEAFELVENRYFLAGTLAGTGTLTLPSFANLELRGADLFPGASASSSD